MPGNTFSFDVFGGINDGQSFAIFPAQNVAFGTTQTYVGAGINGQNITIISNEVIGATRTTEAIIVSAPVKLYTLGTYNGSTVSELVFRLGNLFTGSNPLLLQRFTGVLDLTGTLTFSGGTLPLNPEIGLGQDNQSFTANEFIFTSSERAGARAGDLRFILVGTLAAGMETTHRSRRQPMV